MTMHKAKGLEFPVVVLPHVCRDSFPGGKGSERWTGYAHVVPSELRDDRHVLPALRGYTTKDVTAFVEACRRHDRTGDDRLAYVGLTRAIHTLLATGHWWGATQKSARGPSDYLEALRELATGEIDDPWAEAPSAGPHQGASQDPAEPPTNPMLDQMTEVVWPAPDAPPGEGVVRAARAVSALIESGAIAEPWAAPGLPVAEPEVNPVARQVADWDTAIRALLARSERASDGLLVAPLPGVLSTSAAMELAADPREFAERLLRPMPRRRNLHAELGTAFHAWVEARLGVQPLIADDELPGAADESIGSQEELRVLKDAFERLEFAARTPAGLEVPFALGLGGRLIRGRIDAVFPADPDAPPGQLWEVVDWKTSTHDTADPLQLAIYRLAWADLAGVPPESVGAAFVFIRSGTVVRPPKLADAVEIAALLAGSEAPAEVQV